MAEIFTSSWFVPRQPDCLIIGISRGTPRGQAKGYRRYPKLCPGSWFRSLEPHEFRDRYFSEILSKLDPLTVVADLKAMAGERKAVLVCYEPPPPDDHWCHRGLVSAWLWSSIALAVPELGSEDIGVGWSHPKLHPSLLKDRMVDDAAG